MSISPVSRDRNVRLRRLCRAACVMTLVIVAARVDAASLARVPDSADFFASARACAHSGKYARQECDKAFANAATQIRESRLSFVSKFDCVLAYRLCERVGDAGAYAPTLLGVEIAASRGARVAAPVLAIETPRGFFAPRSVASVYVPGEQGRSEHAATHGDADLRADRFALVDSKEVRKIWSRFSRKRDVDLVPATSSTAAAMEAMSNESATHRRARLHSAPFVQ
jgi:uncharacterized protein YgiB involved in biofilm formation